MPTVLCRRSWLWKPQHQWITTAWARWVLPKV